MHTIEDAKRVQADLNLGWVHVAYVDSDEGMVLAHTDAERASGMNLEDCEVHRWLVSSGSDDLYPYCPRPGWYWMTGPLEARRLAFLAHRCGQPCGRRAMMPSWLK